jgi:hypothetical protein
MACAWLIAATYSFAKAAAPAFVFPASDASEGVALTDADSDFLESFGSDLGSEESPPAAQL